MFRGGSGYRVFTMTNEEMIKLAWSRCEYAVDKVEDHIGEMSQQQRNEVASTLLGMWATIEDALHPDKDRHWDNLLKLLPQP